MNGIHERDSTRVYPCSRDRPEQALWLGGRYDVVELSQEGITQMSS
jgi:hypothetical protein